MNRVFDYVACRSLAQAVDLLNQPGAIPFAGGTDILVAIREGKLRPKLLVDLKAIPELSDIRWADGMLRIGACTNINTLQTNNDIACHFPVLATAGLRFACYELRNRATIGGNIANAAPCAQTAPPLVVLDALVEVLSRAGRRLVPIQEFITGVSSTVLNPGELITALLLPAQPDDSSGIAVRAARVDGMDLASVHLAVQIRHLLDDANREVRFCFGSVTALPARYPDLEEVLSRTFLTRELIQTVSKAVAARIAPRKSSLRASPFYKKAIVGVLLAEALAKLLDNPALACSEEEPRW